MQRLALLNIIIGFATVVLASFFGIFLATEFDPILRMTPESLGTFTHRLQISSHAHTNLFALLQISFGLSLPFSKNSMKLHQLETLGFFLGSFTMAFLLFIKSINEFSLYGKALDILIGAGLSSFLLALLSHCFGLVTKLLR